MMMTMMMSHAHAPLLCYIAPLHHYGHFPGKPGSAGCPLDSQSLIILILSILAGQADTLRTYMAVWTVPCPLTLTAIPRGFEAEGFIDQMLFLTPNQQSQSTEGKMMMM